MKVEEKSAFATIEEAIEDIRQGKFVVVVDAADRENEGDLTIAAQFVTPESINFMATNGRGLICLCLTAERCDERSREQDPDHEREEDAHDEHQRRIRCAAVELDPAMHPHHPPQRRPSTTNGPLEMPRGPPDHGRPIYEPS